MGEIGLFATDHRHTLSLSAETDCVIRPERRGMALLYCEKLKLGFHVRRLVVARLVSNVSKARTVPTGAQPQSAAASTPILSGQCCKDKHLRRPSIRPIAS